MVFWEEHVIPYKLDGFCIDERQMLSLDHALSEVLMDEPSEGPPFVTVEHDEEVISLSYEVMSDV